MVWERKSRSIGHSMEKRRTPCTWRQSQMTELIARDQNRASRGWLVRWPNETPITAERHRFLKTLVDTARSLDGSRLMSRAREVHGDKQNTDLRICGRSFGEFTDLGEASINTSGWY